MNEVSKAVFGVYELNSQISNAKKKLLSEGFYNHEVEVQYPVKVVSQGYSIFHETQVKLFGVIGALMGGVIFSVCAWLAVFGVVPYFSTLSSSADLLTQALIVFVGMLMGMIYGAFSGVLVGIGTSRRSALRYINYLNTGSILMSVSAKNNEKKELAHRTLSLTGAQDITTTVQEGNCWRAVRDKIANYPAVHQVY